MSIEIGQQYLLLEDVSTMSMSYIQNFYTRHIPKGSTIIIKHKDEERKNYNNIGYIFILDNKEEYNHGGMRRLFYTNSTIIRKQHLLLKDENSYFHKD